MSVTDHDLDGTRARATTYMRARGVGVRPSDQPGVLDRATGKVAAPPPVRVYPALDDDAESGVCSIQSGPGMGTLTRTEGGTDVAVRSWLLRLPFDDPASHALRRGDVFTVTESDNPALVGHPLHVHAQDLRGRQVTVKLVLTERSYRDPEVGE